MKRFCSVGETEGRAIPAVGVGERGQVEYRSESTRAGQPRAWRKQVRSALHSRALRNRIVQSTRRDASHNYCGRVPPCRTLPGRRAALSGATTSHHVHSIPPRQVIYIFYHGRLFLSSWHRPVCRAGSCWPPLIPFCCLLIHAHPVAPVSLLDPLISFDFPIHHYHPNNPQLVSPPSILLYYCVFST